jgi:hypothetical protein
MSGKKSWIVFLICIVALVAGCSALAGGGEQWLPCLIWVAIVAPLKEFIAWSVILLITINLLWLRYVP